MTNARPFRHRGALVLLGILSLLGAALVTVASPAQADTKTTRSNTYRQGYNQTVMTRFYSPNICVKTQFQGVLSFRANVITWKRDVEGDTLREYFIDRVRLSNNTLTIHTYKPSGASCTTTRKGYLTLRAKLKVGSYSCSINPSLSVGVPWSVGVSFWPSCGNRELAGWSATDTNGGSYFKMSHTNDVVRFGGSQETNWSPTKRTNLTWNCGGAAADLTPKTGRYVDTKTSAKIRYCPTWNGSTRGW